jgi:hypothetical protein
MKLDDIKSELGLLLRYPLSIVGGDPELLILVNRAMRYVNEWVGGFVDENTRDIFYLKLPTLLNCKILRVYEYDNIRPDKGYPIYFTFDVGQLWVEDNLSLLWLVWISDWTLDNIDQAPDTFAKSKLMEIVECFCNKAGASKVYLGGSIRDLPFDLKADSVFADMQSELDKIKQDIIDRRIFSML